ncbi:MAG: thiamine pyrophosphate-dependent dehydrogenase E1 component subunit alpha [Chloroflexota bacterium]|nr:thiamine pyrophosphate-dependent dehydrogenase E1 component subunit alpha [Chloroflexota bacterium]
MKIPNETLIEMLRRMYRIRHFEEKVIELVDTGELIGSAHTSIGEEATHVGACMALAPDDYEMGNHRSHGHTIAKGAALKPLMAELLGRATGVNRGKSGSMHLADFSIGSLGETSIVGSGLPAAAGAALGAKMLNNGKVSLCFFGDGASNQGTFHESMNLASIWKLPVIYLCENNGYANVTAASYSLSVKDVADRAQGYDMPGVVVDGQDVIAVYEVVQQAAERARKGSGPSLVEAKTYRYREHAEGAMFKSVAKASHYRSDEEYNSWLKRDPIILFRAKLLEMGVITETQADDLNQETHEEVLEAVTYAKESPFPEPQEAFEGLYNTPISV